MDSTVKAVMIISENNRASDAALAASATSASSASSASTFEKVYASGHIPLFTVEGLLDALLETDHAFDDNIKKMFRGLQREEFLFENRHSKKKILLAYEAFLFRLGFKVTKGSYWLESRSEMQEFVAFCGGPSNFSFTKRTDKHYNGGGIDRVRIDLKECKPEWEEVITEVKVLKVREYLRSKKRRHI